MRRALLILTAVTAAHSLAACGSSSSSSSSGVGRVGSNPAPVVRISADPSGAFKFDKAALTASAGKPNPRTACPDCVLPTPTTFAFTNVSPIQHNFTIQDKSGNTLDATPTFSGGSKSFTVTLQPGAYRFLCTVPGHAQRGMSGTLTVK